MHQHQEAWDRLDPKIKIAIKIQFIVELYMKALLDIDPNPTQWNRQETQIHLMPSD